MRRVIVGTVLAVTLGACAQARLHDSLHQAPDDVRPVDFEAWRSRAEGGDPAAQAWLGLAYVAGSVVGRDFVEAVGWLRRAAEQSHAEAQNQLGGMYTYGWGVPQDNAEALRWFQRAAEHGDANAERNVGLMYFDGRGVAQDDNQALEWIRRAAGRGLAAAQRNVGWAYFTGRGVARDDVEGVKWLRRAVEQRDAHAQYELGFAYFNGQGVAKNDGEAVGLWRLAAAQGWPDAQNGLGFAYRNARGVPQDDGEAAVWFRQAARNGLARGQANLGSLYESGQGVPQDLQEAARWYRSAADQSFADAQSNLGLLYEHGRGVPQDPIRAYLWYHLAAVQGNATAIDRRAVLARRMTAAQLNAAWKLALLVKPSHEALRSDPGPPPAPPSFGSSTTTAAPGDLIPRAALFVGERASHPRLSADGQRIAYLAPWHDVQNLWVRTVGERDDRLVTRGTERDIEHFRWQCDGEHLLFLQDRDGDEAWHLYQIDLRNGMTRDLTPLPAASVAPVGFGGGCADPDQALFVVHAGALPSVYRANLRSGTLVSDTENPGDVVEWAIDTARRVRAALARTPEAETVIRVRDDPRAPWRVVQRWGHEETFGHLVGFTADNRSLLLTSSVGASTARLLQMDLVTRRSTVLAEDLEYDVDTILFHPATREVQGVKFLRTRSEWVLLDSSLQPHFDGFRSLCDGDVDVVSRDGSDRTWVVQCVADGHPPVYYLYVPATRAATPLFAPDPTLNGRQLARMQPIAFRSRDGLTLHGYLTVPVGAEPRDLPLVLLVHGGPWMRDAWGWHPTVQWLANRGYAVLQVNFRGSWGYGKTHLRAGDREWGGKMLDDLLDAREWAIQQGYAQSGKACIMGASYGGYATLAALTFAPDAFACGVSFGGVSHLSAQVRAWADPVRWYWQQHVGSVNPDDAFLRTRSPSVQARLIKAPVFLVHGASDRTVYRLQSDLMASALRKHERPVLYLVLPREGHGLRSPANRLRFAAATEQFLARVLGGRAEPPWPQEDFKPFLR